MKNKYILSGVILLLSILLSNSAYSQKTYSFECVECDVTKKAECKDCGGRVSQSSFSGIRVKRGNRVIKELHFPFEVHRSGSKVCIEELTKDGKTFCIGREQTSFQTTRMFFDSLLNCQKDIINGSNESSTETITSIINTINGNPIFTYISEDGTPYIVNETITEVAFNQNGAGEWFFTYTDEAGDKENQNLCTIVRDCLPTDIDTTVNGLNVNITNNQIEIEVTDNAGQSFSDNFTLVWDSGIIDTTGMTSWVQSLIPNFIDTRNTLISTDGSVGITPMVLGDGSTLYDLDVDLFDTDTTGLKQLITDCIPVDIDTTVNGISFTIDNTGLVVSVTNTAGETFTDNVVLDLFGDAIDTTSLKQFVRDCIPAQLEYSFDIDTSIVNDTTFFYLNHFENGIEISEDTVFSTTFDYDYLTTNSGIKSDYITSIHSNSVIESRITEDHTPTDLLSDIRSGNVKVYNEVFDNGVWNYPTTWTGETGVELRREGDHYTTDVDKLLDFREKYMITETGGITYWVDVDSGSDGNNGLSEATAFKTIEFAKNQADAMTLMVRGGIYNTSFGFNTGLSKSMNIIGYDGRVIVGGVNNLGFTVNGSFSNVWGITAAQTNKIVSATEVDELGVPVPYTLVNSIAEVSETTMSYYNDGATIWVHSSSQPFSKVDVLPIRSFQDKSIVINNSSPAGTKAYLENIEFAGGTLNRNNGTGCEMYFYNCKFWHNNNTSNDGNLVNQHIENTVINKCVSRWSITDGFNYHDVGDLTVGFKILEINCVSIDNGFDLIGSDQASTIHETGRAIRVNGIYESVGVQVIADANFSQSINLGIELRGDPSSVGMILTDGGWIIEPNWGVVKSVQSGGDLFLNGIDYFNFSYLGGGIFSIY